MTTRPPSTRLVVPLHRLTEPLRLTVPAWSPSWSTARKG